MSAEFDNTLSIGSLRLRPEEPQVNTPKARPADPVLHPEAAAAARARIADIVQTHPVADIAMVPAAPTADLVTDRQKLVHQLQTAAPSVTHQRGLPSVVKPVLAAVGIFFLVLLLFKAPIIISQLSYRDRTAIPQATEAPGTGIIPAENSITIPKINVHAPIILEPSMAEPDIQKSLEKGVVHYASTAKPGEKGNVAIFGHSSNDWWEPGDYKFVFVLLDKLAPGDRLTLDYQSQRYTYEVTSATVVEPSNVGVLAPTTAPTLTLITCSPPGTSLRRLVVTAKQIDPNPNTAVASTADAKAAADDKIPSSSKGFFEQLGQAFSGVGHGLRSLFGGDSSDQPDNNSNNTPDQLPVIK